MSNSYEFIDADFTYTDPNTGLLRNLQGITDPDVLIFVNFGCHINLVFKIYRNLFQDIYSWAGKKRRVEISKEGKQFFPTSHIDNALRFIDQLIAEFKQISKDNKKKLAEKLAEILDSVNYLHPFREGNGRTQREFLRLLALEKGLTLNLNPPDNKSVFERYMKGTIESDLKILTELILDLTDSRDK